ncbi:MAG: DUF308 domain-containing protein [Alphaproteobacteria bacterium]|nr:DUF308 domain-containing protein [Alphaproteobacteria bacterium]
MPGRVQFGSDFQHIEIELSGRMPAKWFLIQGYCLIGLGLLAVALPHIVTLAIELLVGALLFAGGMLRTVSVLRTPDVPGFWLSLSTAVLASLLGLLFLVWPGQGILTLNVLLIALFIAEGVGAVALALWFRPYLRTWPWAMFSGLVDLCLAYLIWQGWPDTAAWAIGLLVGVKLFFLGIAMTMVGLTLRAMEKP